MANDRPDSSSSPSSGTPAVVWLGAAAILGASIVAAGALVAQSIGDAGQQLDAIRVVLMDLEKTTRTAAAPAPAPAPAPTARRGLDPNKRYSVQVGQYVKGPDDAKVTIVEWSDFQCPFCRRSRPTLEQIEKEYGDQVRIAFRHLPLSFHSKAPAAHAAAAAAGLQGKFWEMHDKIFENQQQMSPQKYEQWAGELGLDVDQFKRDVASEQVKQAIETDKKAAEALGVTGTPAFFVNGRYVRGAQPFPAFKTLIDEELKAAS
jgi:protein-disulfide isomerase